MDLSGDAWAAERDRGAVARGEQRDHEGLGGTRFCRTRGSKGSGKGLGRAALSPGWAGGAFRAAGSVNTHGRPEHAQSSAGILWRVGERLPGDRTVVWVRLGRPGPVFRDHHEVL